VPITIASMLLRAVKGEEWGFKADERDRVKVLNVVRLEDIPECAICPRCGQPYKVIDLGPQGASLGIKVPEGSSVFRCCGNGELTIEDEIAMSSLKDLLLAYHAQQKEIS
jgi:hypothetical protein